MKYPVEVDGREQLVQVFVAMPAESATDYIATIDDRHYRFYRDEARKLYYFMTKVGAHARSVQAADVGDAVKKLVQVHRIYREYDNHCRKSKEDAQRRRDQALHKIATHD